MISTNIILNENTKTISSRNTNCRCNINVNRNTNCRCNIKVNRNSQY